MIASLPNRPVGRVAFLGTPDIAAGVFQALIEDGIEIALVVTRHDKRRGRGSEMMPSPVKRVAEIHGVKVVHTVDELLEEHGRQRIDLGVVVAFGEIIRPHVLAEIPMVNLHVSLLPRWRGAAPVERAILAGDEMTGVCLMQVEEGLDTGGVISSASVPIGSLATADEVRDQLMVEGTKLLLQALHTGAFSLEPQRGEPTYAAKIESVEHHIDWSESADLVSRRVRIGDAWTTFRSRRLKVHSVESVVAPIDSFSSPGSILIEGGHPVVTCGGGFLRLVDVQPEGRPRIAARDWVRGARITPGESMGDE